VQDCPASIYELQEIELIPFYDVSTQGTASKPVGQSIEYQLNAIREGIKKFLECGFYVASQGFDITSNSQRRDRYLVNHGAQEDPFKALDMRYMWNYNLYK